MSGAEQKLDISVIISLKSISRASQIVLVISTKI